MTTEKHCEFVSSRGIALYCQHYPKIIKSDTNHFDTKDYQNIQNGDKVYVISSALNKFTEHIFPTIVKKDISIVLVTGACVTSVPVELGKVHKTNYIDFIEKNKKHISRWYTQNCDVVNHDIIKIIPLGIDYHTLQSKKHYWGPIQSAVDQENLLKTIANEHKGQKQMKCFSYFHFLMFERHGRDRHMAKNALNNKPFNDFLPARIPRDEIWKKHEHYHFIVSPHGNGLDCHRTWEALALGCIPIVRTSSLNSLFEGLPVLIVNKWTDVNEDLLQKTVETFSKTQFQMEKLTLRYWVDSMNPE